MSPEEREEFDSCLGEYLDHPMVKKLDDYVAHGKISVLTHSLDVAMTAYRLDKAFHVNADPHTLLVGALLHDFYLYDWHQARLFVNIFKMHGYTHPGKASENAAAYFGVNEGIQEVIRCHMWPLTLRSFPRSREARLVCVADKICAIREMMER